MNIWRLTTMNLHELLRRLRAGESRNAIARAMHISPNTVKAYRRWAEAQPLLSGPLPDLATLEARRAQTLRADRAPRHPNESSLEGYRAEVTELPAHGRKRGFHLSQTKSRLSNAGDSLDFILRAPV